MSRVLFAQSAQADLLEAWLFIAEENMDAADGELDGAIDAAATKLRDGFKGA